MKGQKELERIIKNEEEGLPFVYNRHKRECCKYFQFGCYLQPDQAQLIYNEAIMTMVLLIRQKKLVELRCKMYTFLISISLRLIKSMHSG